jgi:hypothetical protein
LIRSIGANLDEDVVQFIAAAGDEFHMQTLSDAGDVASSLGFVDLELVDRCAWYHEERRSES